MNQVNNNMIKRHWLQKKNNIIEKSTLHKISSSFKNLPLQIFFKAVSPFSGPIALLYNKSISHHYILPKQYDCSIIIMNVKGEVKKLISFSIKDRIIFFGFLKYEQLLIVDASGDFWIIDPYSANITPGSFKGKNKHQDIDKPQRFRGCEILPKQKLLLLKERNLGIVHSLHSQWQQFIYLKPSYENPLFCGLGDQYPNQFIFLSKQNTIDHYNFQIQNKSTLYFDQLMSENASFLLGISYNKKKSLLGMVYREPSKIVIVNTVDKSNKIFEPVVDLLRAQQALLSVNGNQQTKISYKYKSVNKYKSIGTQVGWFSCNFEREQIQNFLQGNNKMFQDYFVFCNQQMIILSNGQSFHMQIEKNLLISIQNDSLRVISENGHTFYRLVPHLYRLLVNPDQINEADHNKQLLKFIKLRQQFSNFLNNKIVSIQVLNSYIDKNKQIDFEIRESQNQQCSQHQEQKRQKVSSDISNIIRLGREQLCKLQSQILQPLMQCCSYCIDPVDQVKIMKFICWVKNYYESKIDINELCQQFRIVNALKFQYMNRTLTLQQFRHLKYEEKDRFMTILLRYNMHYQANLIFKSTSDWLRIFLHWSKCKIEKNSQTVAFEQIKDKYEQLTSKNKNSSVFTDIAKYCMDRHKFSLAQNFIDLEENPDHKIMIYLMLINAKKDRKMIDKLLVCTQQTSRQYLVYRVIKQLIDAQWVQNHVWVNILHGKPRVTKYYLQYLKHHNNQQLLNKYYVQNKQFATLGFFQLSKQIKGLSKQDDLRSQYQIFYKYKEQDTSKIINKYQQFKKLIPNLHSVMKFFHKNEALNFLRSIKNKQKKVTSDQILAIKDDIILQYIGQILLQQGQDELGLVAIKCIRSQKAFSILQRKGKIDDAIKLAFSLGKKDMLIEIGEKHEDFQQQIQQMIQLLKKHGVN